MLERKGGTGPTWGIITNQIIKKALMRCSKNSAGGPRPRGVSNRGARCRPRREIGGARDRGGGEPRGAGSLWGPPGMGRGFGWFGARAIRPGMFPKSGGSMMRVPPATAPPAGRDDPAGRGRIFIPPGGDEKPPRPKQGRAANFFPGARTWKGGKKKTGIKFSEVFAVANCWPPAGIG